MEHTHNPLSTLPHHGRVSPSEAKIHSMFDQFLHHVQSDEFLVEQLKPEINDTHLLSPHEFTAALMYTIEHIQSQKHEPSVSPEFLELQEQVQQLLSEEVEKSQQLSTIRHSLLLG